LEGQLALLLEVASGFVQSSVESFNCISLGPILLITGRPSFRIVNNYNNEPGGNPKFRYHYIRSLQIFQLSFSKSNEQSKLLGKTIKPVEQLHWKIYHVNFTGIAQ
jgi:hypothetical protein